MNCALCVKLSANAQKESATVANFPQGVPQITARCSHANEEEWRLLYVAMLAKKGGRTSAALPASSTPCRENTFLARSVLRKTTVMYIPFRTVNT